MPTPLNSLDTLKGFLDIRADVVRHDTVLGFMSEAASEQIEAEIGVTLAQGVRTDNFNTRRNVTLGHDLHGNSDTGLTTRNSRQQFWLTGFPLDSAADFIVKYDPSQVFGDDTVLVADQDYHIDTDEGVLTLFYGTSEYTKALRVEYTAGFEVVDDHMEASAPSGLKMAHLFQTAYLYKRGRNDNIGLTSDAAVSGDQTNRPAARWNTDVGLCNEAVGLLAPYKRPLVGRG